ncbi:hypothetical protein CKAH01_10510 [Colletotrichum kahawae]|uniref:Uncharacterized protein n=1 Tax=Colletotrichum kahawae TaxID=34407 RepID=A0AAD9XX21_COLKA|nr:hypothetical protein CKAH01_10510 [Colletotrichum kahawae]
MGGRNEADHQEEEEEEDGTTTTTHRTAGAIKKTKKAGSDENPGCLPHQWKFGQVTARLPTVLPSLALRFYGRIGWRAARCGRQTSPTHLVSRIHPSSALPTAADRRLPFARDCDARGTTITPSSAVTHDIPHLCGVCHGGLQGLRCSTTRISRTKHPQKTLRSSRLRISEAISIGPDRQRLSPACDAPGPADCYSTFHLGTTESRTLTCPPRTGLWPTQRHQKRGLSDRAIPLLDSLATQTADWNHSTTLVRLSMTWGRGRQTPPGGPRMAAPPLVFPFSLGHGAHLHPGSPSVSRLQQHKLCSIRLERHGLVTCEDALRPRLSTFICGAAYRPKIKGSRYIKYAFIWGGAGGCQLDLLRRRWHWSDRGLHFVRRQPVWTGLDWVNWYAVDHQAAGALPVSQVANRMRKASADLTAVAPPDCYSIRLFSEPSARHQLETTPFKQFGRLITEASQRCARNHPRQTLPPSPGQLGTLFRLRSGGTHPFPSPNFRKWSNNPESVQRHLVPATRQISL